MAPPAPPAALAAARRALSSTTTAAAAATTSTTSTSAAAFAAALEPYKRLGGVLIRDDCLSVALSNEYLTLCEGLGGVMLRDGGRVPARALQRLVLKAAEPGELAGWVIACERGTPSPDLLAPARAATLGELQRALAGLTTPSGGAAALHSQQQQQIPRQQLPIYWQKYDAAAAPSCRLVPAAGPAAAAAAAGAANAAAAGDAGGATCSLGAGMLQAFLDELQAFLDERSTRLDKGFVRV